MPDSAGAGAGALDAMVVKVENPDDATEVFDAVHRVRRLTADVAQCQRVLDELETGAALMAAKAVEIDKIYKAKAKETDKMIVAARKALGNAERALKAAGA